MPAVLVLAALAVVAATVVLAFGRGGSLAEAPPDHPPSGLPLDRVPRSTDARLLRLPKSPWGYNVPMTDDALARLSLALADREAHVAYLERELAAVRGTPPPDLGGAAGSTALEPWELSELKDVQYAATAPESAEARWGRPPGTDAAEADPPGATERDTPEEDEPATGPPAGWGGADRPYKEETIEGGPEKPWEKRREQMWWEEGPPERH